MKRRKFIAALGGGRELSQTSVFSLWPHGDVVIDHALLPGPSDNVLVAVPVPPAAPLG